MKVAKKKTKVKAVNVTAGGDTMFFRGEFSGTNAHMTDKQWVKYMNKKHGFKWTGRD